MIIEIPDELIEMAQKEYDFWMEYAEEDLTMNIDYESLAPMQDILQGIRLLKGFIK